MPNIFALKNEEYEIMKQLSELEGDVTNNPEIEESLILIQNKIEQKTQAYISVTQKDGLIDREIASVKDMIAKAKDYIDKLEDRKGWIEGVINKLILEAPEKFLEFDNGVKQYVKPFFKKKSEIDLTKVEEQWKSYQLPKMTFLQKEALQEAINAFLDDNELYLQDNPVLAQNAESLKEWMNDSKASCLLSDLPEGHSAISVALTPSYKIVKTRPKEA